LFSPTPLTVPSSARVVGAWVAILAQGGVVEDHVGRHALLPGGGGAPGPELLEDGGGLGREVGGRGGGLGGAGGPGRLGGGLAAAAGPSRLRPSTSALASVSDRVP